MFHRAGRFPAAEGIGLPLSSEAVQFYKSGQPFLQHNLPFWMASLAGRLLVLLIPTVAVLYPMFRFLPGLYGWVMRRKIARLYGELRFLEDEITSGGPTDHARLMARLDQLERQAIKTAWLAEARRSTDRKGKRSKRLSFLRPND